MDKMKMETVNQAEENMEKIAQLFPNCVTEIEGENGKLKKAIEFDNSNFAHPKQACNNAQQGNVTP